MKRIFDLKQYPVCNNMTLHGKQWLRMQIEGAEEEAERQVVAKKQQHAMEQQALRLELETVMKARMEAMKAELLKEQASKDKKHQKQLQALLLYRQICLTGTLA